MFDFREVLSATIDELSKKTGGGENNCVKFSII